MTWLVILRKYFSWFATTNLAWETAHLPLYTIWTEGSAAWIAFSVVHCTGGDLLIGGASLLGALLLFGNSKWPAERYWAVAVSALVIGLAYTVYSEWHNTVVTGDWAYSGLMPIIPWTGIGLSPVAQWFIIPLSAFGYLRWRGDHIQRPNEQT
ncbi:MAG: hypothetical protein ABI705_05920 [Aestuariivirga sp.]